MKEVYEKPEVEVVLFDKDDMAVTITMSIGGVDEGPGAR